MRFLRPLVLSSVAVRGFVPRSSAVYSKRAPRAASSSSARALSTMSAAGPPFVIMVKVEIEEARVPAFLEAMKIDAAGSRTEEKCYRFDLLKDQSKPNTYYFYECYHDAAAVDVHKTFDHYKAWAARRRVPPCSAYPMMMVLCFVGLQGRRRRPLAGGHEDGRRRLHLLGSSPPHEEASVEPHSRTTRRARVPAIVVYCTGRRAAARRPRWGAAPVLLWARGGKTGDTGVCTDGGGPSLRRAARRA